MTDNLLRDYSAFLLRMWRDRDGEAWRAALQEVDGGTLMRFRDLEALFEYLRERTATNFTKDRRGSGNAG
jgi:hypothetical protein